MLAIFMMEKNTNKAGHTGFLLVLDLHQQAARATGCTHHSEGALSDRRAKFSHSVFFLRKAKSLFSELLDSSRPSSAQPTMQQYYDFDFTYLRPKRIWLFLFEVFSSKCRNCLDARSKT